MSNIINTNSNYAYLSLGSNLGNSKLKLKKAVDFINNFSEIKELKDFKNHNVKTSLLSSVFKSEPQLYKEQNYFYNQVVKICKSYFHQAPYTS